MKQATLLKQGKMISPYEDMQLAQSKERVAITPEDMIYLSKFLTKNESIVPYTSGEVEIVDKFGKTAIVKIYDDCYIIGDRLSEGKIPRPVLLPRKVELKGHLTRAPAKKRSPAVRVDVRKMF